MAKNEKRVKVTLECQECKRRNYITMKNKLNDRERIELKKYCAHDRRHTNHKETRWPSSRPAGRSQSATVGSRGPRRAVAQLEELRSPKPAVGGSSPSCPAIPSIAL